MERDKHWIEVPTYQELTADIPALETAFRKLQAHIDNAQSEYNHGQRLRQTWRILTKMIDAGKVTLDSHKFILVDEFAVENFGRRAPIYVSNKVVFEVDPSIREEVRRLNIYGVNPELADAISAVYAPFRYRPAGSLDERLKLAHTSPDFFGLSLEFLFRRDIERAVEYMQRAINVRSTRAREFIVDNTPAIRLVVDNSAEMDRVRTIKYGLPSLLEPAA